MAGATSITSSLKSEISSATDVASYSFPMPFSDRRAYSAQAEERFRKLGLEFTSVHDVSNASRTIERSEIIFIGGGNTFRLLHQLQKNELIEPLRASDSRWIALCRFQCRIDRRVSQSQNHEGHASGPAREL